jgi:hypothetical protein
MLILRVEAMQLIGREHEDVPAHKVDRVGGQSAFAGTVQDAADSYRRMRVWGLADTRGMYR